MRPFSTPDRTFRLDRPLPASSLPLLTGPGGSEPLGLVMAKTNTIKIRLNSSADTGYFYVTRKNSRTMTEKMKIKKYDPKARKHVEFTEGKIK